MLFVGMSFKLEELRATLDGSALRPQSSLPNLAAFSRPSSCTVTCGRAKKYGTRFHTGFLEFYRNGELCDVEVVFQGQTYHLHMLILALHSEFFRTSFTSEFREKQERKVCLGFDDPSNVWPIMLEYFYTEEIALTPDNVLPLFAMSRELMVPRIQEYCSDYAQNSLEASNAIQYLSQAVQFNCDSFRDSCISLVAEGFPSSFLRPCDGLPVEVVLEILQHPKLMVQTEEQVLLFVLGYAKRHVLPDDVVRKLFEQVKFSFLSNERLSQLSSEELVPKDMLLLAMAHRLQLIDHPERLPSSGPSAPRKTYCCSVDYGLPGGSEFAALPIEGVWDELVPLIKVTVQGDLVEGDPQSVLRLHDDSAWFTVSGDTAFQPVWVELELPANTRVMELTKYTFSHGMNLTNHMFPYGISDSAWFQMKGLSTQVSPGALAGDSSTSSSSSSSCPPSESFTPLRTHESSQMHTEYCVTVEQGSSRGGAPWRKMRIVATPASAEETVRLSIRKLRLYGRLEVSLTQEGVGGKDLLGCFREKKKRSHTAAAVYKPADHSRSSSSQLY